MIATKFRDRIAELAATGLNPTQVFRALQKEYLDQAPVYATVRKHCSGKVNRPIGEKGLSSTLSADLLPIKADYNSTSKHLSHRKLVYEDLSRTSGKILAITSPQLLDAPAALEAGISLGRLYLTGDQLNTRHTTLTPANLILASHINIACNRAAHDLSIKFSAANLDLTCALNAGMINMMRIAGATDCWDRNAVISINLPNSHVPEPYATLKAQLAQDPEFCQLFAHVFNIGMPMSYVKQVCNTLLPALCGMYAFCQGAKRYPKPFGHKYNIYTSVTHTSMGWVTFELSSVLDDTTAKFGAYLHRLVSL